MTQQSNEALIKKRMQTIFINNKTIFLVLNTMFFLLWMNECLFLIVLLSLQKKLTLVDVKSETLFSSPLLLFDKIWVLEHDRDKVTAAASDVDSDVPHTQFTVH